MYASCWGRIEIQSTAIARESVWECRKTDNSVGRENTVGVHGVEGRQGSLTRRMPEADNAALCLIEQSTAKCKEGGLK